MASVVGAALSPPTPLPALLRLGEMRLEPDGSARQGEQSSVSLGARVLFHSEPHQPHPHGPHSALWVEPGRQIFF